MRLLPRRQLLLAAAALTSCSRLHKEPRILRVAAPMGVGISSLYLAHELGLFKRAGLDVEIISYTRTPEMVSALAGNKIEILFATQSTAFLNAVVRGTPIRVVAGRENVSPTCRRMALLCGLKRRFPEGLADLRILRGKRIAAGGTIGFMQFALEEHLARAGLTPGDVEVMNVRGPEALAALFSGGLDALLLFDEALAGNRLAELTFSRGFAEIYPNFQYGLIHFGATLRESDPSVGRRFLVAYFQGVREFQEGRTPKFLKDLADAYGADRGKMELVCRSNFVTNGWVDEESFRLFAAWAHRRGHTSRLVSFPEAVDLRFLTHDS